MALRYFAHSNGCDLVFGSVKEKLPSQLYRAVLSSHVFSEDNKSNVHTEINPANPICVYAGKD